MSFFFKVTKKRELFGRPKAEPRRLQDRCTKQLFLPRPYVETEKAENKKLDILRGGGGLTLP